MISPSISLPPKFGIANLRKIRPFGNILSDNSIADDFTLNGSLVGAVKMPLTLANNIDSLSLFFSSCNNWQEKCCPHSLYLHFFCRSPKGFCLSRKIRVWSKSCCETENYKNICIDWRAHQIFLSDCILSREKKTPKAKKISWSWRLTDLGLRKKPATELSAE